MRRPFEILGLCILLSACRHGSAAEPPAPATESSSASGPAWPPALEPSADTSVASSPIQEFRGSYSRGFEASWFIPCDAPRNDALWWVTLTEEARHQRDSLLKASSAQPTGALAVRWRGSTSRRMPSGHMGQGTRYILVTQVLEVRPLISREGCPFRSASKASAVPLTG